MTSAIRPAGLLVACLAMVMLSVWLPVIASRRWVPAPWRPFTSAVGAAVILALVLWCAVLSFAALAPTD